MTAVPADRIVVFSTAFTKIVVNTIDKRMDRVSLRPLPISCHLQAGSSEMVS